MSWGIRIGILSVLLTLLGISSFSLLADKKWIGWLSLALAVCILIAWIILEIYCYKARTVSKKKSTVSKRNKLIKKYPHKQRGNWYRAIKTKAHGEIFLHDLKTNRKHHIINMETMEDLRLLGSVEDVSPEELDSIDTDGPINTRNG